MTAQGSATTDQLVSEVANHERRQLTVCHDKVLRVKSWNKAVETLDETDDDRSDQSPPAQVWLKWSAVRQGVSRDTLSFASLHEPNVREHDGNPGGGGEQGYS